MDSSSTTPAAELWLYRLLAGVVILSAVLALYTEIYPLAATPLVLMGILLVIKDIRYVYYGFFALLPLSVEVQLGALGTDLPSEPLMLLLTGIAFVLFLQRLKDIPRRIVYHPISALLIIHLGWILVTAIFSTDLVISLKFWLAKIWYVVPFYFLTFYMLASKADILKLYWFAVYPLLAVVVIVIARHAMVGFTFDTSNEVVYPIFRNHVTYAAIMVTVLPYLWTLWSKEKYKWQLAAILVLAIGTYFSYTRAAHLCLFIMAGAYYVVRYRLARHAVLASSIGAMLLVVYLVQDNNYLDFAPDFEKTITHDDFGNLVEATYKLEDISTMERVYRWVAGGYMIAEKPIIGYGPNTFYHNYTKFTISSFETYVSDNPEKSGVHCYYLMTWIEQGIIGLLIFLSICICIILIGEQTYHRLTDPTSKAIVMASILSIISILALQLINDLIETDKIGPFFFLNAAVIVKYALESRRDSRSTSTLH